MTIRLKMSVDEYASLLRSDIDDTLFRQFILEKFSRTPLLAAYTPLDYGFGQSIHTSNAGLPYFGHQYRQTSSTDRLGGAPGMMLPLMVNEKHSPSKLANLATKFAKKQPVDETDYEKVPAPLSSRTYKATPGSVMNYFNLPMLKVGDISDQLFGYRSMNVAMNPEVYDPSLNNPFETEWMKKNYFKVINMQDFNDWDPLMDLETLRKYYRFSPDRTSFELLFKRFNYGDKVSANEIGTDGALNIEFSHDHLDTSTRDRENKRFNWDLSKGVRYEDYDVVIIPKLTGKYKSKNFHYNVDPIQIYMTIGSTLLTPKTTRMYKDWRDIGTFPQLYAKSGYFTDESREKTSVYETMYQNGVNTAYNNLYDGMGYKTHPMFVFGIANEDNSDFHPDYPFVLSTFNTVGADKGTRTSFNNKQLTSLFMNMEQTSANEGFFVWKPKKNHPLLEGEIRVRYMTANSLPPQRIMKHAPFLAFVPGKFGTGVTLTRTLPVNNQEQETLDAELKALNTDEVRTALLETFKTEGQYTGDSVTMDNFDKILDAPRNALPYVYDAKDLLKGGKYRPNYTPTVVESVLDVNDGRPAYTEQFGFSEEWPTTPRTLELHLPYQGVDLPEDVGEDWEGLGNVLPFEMVTFSSNVLKRTSYLKPEEMTKSILDKSSRGLVTRVDQGMNTVSPFPDFYNSGYEGKGLFDASFTKVLEPFYLTDRWDLDYIYTPPHSDFMDASAHQHNANGNFWDVSKNTGFNFRNAPSLLLMGREFDSFKDGHLPVPARLLKEDGQYFSMNFGVRTLTSFIPSKRNKGALTRGFIYYDSEQTYPMNAVGSSSNGGRGVRLPTNFITGGDDDPIYAGSVATQYLKLASRFNSQLKPGRFLISDGDTETKVKMDTLFNDRLVGYNMLDLIRGGRHFNNYVLQHDTAESLNPITTLGIQATKTFVEGKRFKNFVGNDFRQHMRLRNLDEEINFVRDVKPLSIKDNRTYRSSDGFSMILKPADTTYVNVDIDGNVAKHVDQAVHFAEHKAYDLSASNPVQNRAFTGYLDYNNSQKSYTTYNSNHIVMTRQSSGEYEYGTTEYFHDQMFDGNANYYRHLKGTNVPQTTASYLLSFIFNQNKWLEDRKAIRELLKVDDLERVFLSSYVWYDEKSVSESLKRRDSYYFGARSIMFRSRSTEVFLDNRFSSSDLNYYPFNTRLNRATTLLRTYQDMYKHTIQQVMDGDERVENNYLSHVNGSYGTLTEGMIDFDIKPELTKAPGLIMTGQLNSFLYDANNLAGTLPAYFKATDPLSYTYFSALRWVGYNYNYSNVTTNRREYMKHPRTGESTYVNLYPDSTALFWDNMGYGNTYVNYTDMSTMFKHQTPMFTGSALINKRIWEPVDMLIPTKLKDEATDWSNPENWVMMAGHEEQSSYALMDQITVNEHPIQLGKVRAYPVTVPVMIRPPKEAYDLSNRVCLLNRDPRKGRPHHVDASPFNWFDFLASPEPFLYEFHVADISSLLAVAAKNDPSITYVDDNRLLTYTPTEALSDGRLTKVDEDTLKKTVGNQLGITPLFLVLTYIPGKEGYQAVLSYSDEKVKLGIPMFAGEIYVNYKKEASLGKLTMGSVVVNGRDTTNMTEEELIAWYEKTKA